ncbi:MAG TPA: ATP-binding protein [Vicinamibacterales bacterium]|nr:ATP-binding protein [Vicinamibacterales bacterium]
MRVSDAGRDVVFTLRILPLTSPQPDACSLLVVFEPEDWTTWWPPSAPTAGATAQERDVALLRAELAANKHHLQSTLDAHEVSTQELRAAHEEVLSSNEELQSTNEELQTTKEELQSANEELITVNEQYQTRNRELDTLADDLANFIGSADVPMLTVGRDLSIRRMTPAAQRTFNVLPTDVGRSIEHIKFSLTVDGIGDIVERVIASMQPWQHEVRDVRGTWWMLRVRPYLTADNRIDGATLVAIDIDSVKRSHELQESRDYAIAVVQTVREPLVVLDGEGRVGLANEAFYRLVDAPSSQVEGRLLWETSQGLWSDPSFRRSLLKACQGQETIVNLELQRMIVGKGLRTLVLTARGISREDRPNLLLLAIDDVTESRQADRLRIDTETLRLMDRRKDEFLGILAHELRNPLAPMRFALDLLRRPEVTGPQVLRSREVLERQVQHMVRIVDDLLDVSRITQGKVELRKEPLPLADMVHAAVELSRPAVDAAHHTLTVSLPDEPVVVHGDSVRLTQVLVNLLNNAIKFTPPAGHIWLIAETIGEIPEHPDRVRIRIRDTGIGIAANLLPRVFDMFTQGDRSLERTRGGLGVGLTLVRNLVALHGGEVDVRSEGEGRGSEFIVSLPLDESAFAARVAAVPTTQARPRTGLRILVADDNQDGREMLQYLLTHEGHIVTTAEDGNRALDAASSSDLDVAILDISMPGLNGYELAGRLRDDTDRRRPLLVAMSGFGQAEDRTRAIEAGFDHHFTKPVDMSALLELLARHLPR